MNKIEENVVQLGTGYYYFFVRDEKYLDSTFEPKIYISRVNAKVIKLYVEIYEHVRSKQRTYLRRLISYNQNVDNQEQYFQHIQNSNFELAVPNSLIFLEKVVNAIKQIVEKQSGIIDPSINVEPIDGYGGKPYLSVYKNDPYDYQIWAVSAPSGTFSISGSNTTARLTATQGTMTYAIATELGGNSTVTFNSGTAKPLTATINWV